MNTRQKLTLGIAAIFMVTLTIVGVTYAYFVTRVNFTGTETKAVIKTAEIGSSINTDEPITMENAIPGDTVWEAFAVNTGSDVDVSFSILVSTALAVDPATNPGSTPTVADNAFPQFIHTLQADGETTAANVTSGFDVNNVCYVQTVPDGQTQDDCYKGVRYDNIELTLYRVHSKHPNAQDETRRIFGTGDYYETIKGTLQDGETYYEKFIEEEFNAETAVTSVKSDSTTETGKTLKLQRKTGETVDFEVGASIVFDGTLNMDGTFTPKSTQEVDGVTMPKYEAGIKAPYMGSFIQGNAIIMGGSQTVLKKPDLGEGYQGDISNGYNLYVLKVTYVNVNKNQNIENDAAVNIKIDIAGDAQVSN